MSSLSIGLSGLLVNQRLIDLTGQNIANAGTPSYHRQVGELAARLSGDSIGTGVELKSITRIINRLLEDAIVRNNSSLSGSATRLDGLNQLQAFLAPGEGSLHAALTRFFNVAETLSAQPDNLTQRRIFLFAASDLADSLSETGENFNQLRGNLRAQATASISTVNALTEQIGRFNQQIHDFLATGGTANELLDQRDEAITKLSEFIDVRVVPQEFGQVNVLTGGTPIVLNSSVIELNVDLDDKNQLSIRTAGSLQSIDIAGGKLGGILSLANIALPGIQAQFDTFAQELVMQINRVHAGGLGLDGPLTSLASQRPVAAPGMPLAAANLSSPLTAGDLYITVTNLTTGQRTLSRVAIDPATQSLTSVAASISAIANLQAVVDPQIGSLNLIARPGYGFDFTGNFSTAPDFQTITGTTTPTLGGTYTGGFNDTLQFTFVGSGTIGSGAGLALEVRNGAGALLNSLNVGQGYEAGADLPAVLGVKVRLSTGTVNNGDSFSLNVAADSDTVGLLSGLGLHSFFVGRGAADLRINPDLLTHPENLALSRTGQPGDGTNLARLLSLRDQPTFNGQTQSFQQFLEDIIGNVGSQTQDTQIRKNAFDALGQQLESQRQSDSGVDPNEELMKLVQYQRSYQISAHYLQVVNQTMDDLVRLVGN